MVSRIFHNFFSKHHDFLWLPFHQIFNIIQFTGKVYQAPCTNESQCSSLNTEEMEEELEDLSLLEDELEQENANNDFDDDDNEVPTSKEGIPLNKQGVCSPAEIKIRSLKEGGRPNPKRLQLITISSPKSSNDKLDENDLNLVLEEPTLLNKSDENISENNKQQPEKKRVQLISLNKNTSSTKTSSPSNNQNSSDQVKDDDSAKKKRVPFVTLSK